MDDGHLRGYNTDVEGVRAALVAVAGDSLSGEPALILGAGGAARAAALALARLGCPLVIVNRTASAAERLSSLVVEGVPGASCGWLPLSALTEQEVQRQRVVVNATSLGMAGEGKVPALLADNVTAGQVVFDVVYAAPPTDFLAAAQTRGATVVDGLTMLLRQAAEAFSLWTGVPAPLEVMQRCRPVMTGRPGPSRVLTGQGGEELEPIMVLARAFPTAVAVAGAVGRRRRRRSSRRRWRRQRHRRDGADIEASESAVARSIPSSSSRRSPAPRLGLGVRAAYDSEPIVRSQRHEQAASR